jgi:hypothetical protein
MTIIEDPPVVTEYPPVEIADMPPLVVADPVPAPKPIWPHGAPTARAVDILEVALVVLRKNGWTQGSLRRNDGSVCALGALQTAAVGRTGPGLLGPPKALHRAKQAVIDVIYGYDTRGYGSIEQWNDTPGRTQRDVEAAFKEAIRRLNR